MSKDNRAKRDDSRVQTYGPARPRRVSEVIEQLKRTTSLGDRLEQARIWSEWPTVAGPDLFEHGRPVTVRDNTLVIEAESSVWMHKFAYKKWTILNRINRLAKRELVSDIFIQLMPDAETRGEQEDS